MRLFVNVRWLPLLHRVGLRGRAMSFATDDPEFWSTKAEEARTIASELKDEARRALMMTIADDYDLLASLTLSEKASL